MGINDIPGGSGSCQAQLQPGRLRRIGFHPVRFVQTTVERKEVNWSPGKVIVALVAGQGEIILGWLRAGGFPVVVAQAWKETVYFRAGTVAARIRINIVVEILADIGVDGVRRTGGIVVVAHSDDDVRLPAVDECSHIGFGSIVHAEIADDGKRHPQRFGGLSRSRCLGWREGRGEGWGKGRGEGRGEGGRLRRGDD